MEDIEWDVEALRQTLNELLGYADVSTYDLLMAYDKSEVRCGCLSTLRLIRLSALLAIRTGVRRAVVGLLVAPIESTRATAV